MDKNLRLVSSFYGPSFSILQATVILYCSVALIMGSWVDQSPYLRNWRICVILIGLCVLRGVKSGYNLVLTIKV